jgi:cellulose synthase/poly-beta-1,6-N-acetylglucosamine synthase-like glycosyltransferase
MALAAQDFAEEDEFILCESDEFQDQLFADLTGMLPGLRMLFVSGKSSYKLKNAAVEAVSGELIAMIDADCVPRTEWLRRRVDSLRNIREPLR